ncbi:hypothetical protein ACA910_011474 [Epithemia clementina (nom. ined.)]
MAELHGKHRPSKLSSSRQDMVQKIHCFGLQLAAAIFQLVLDDRRKPMYDVFISFAGQDRDDYVTLLRNEMPREWDIFLDHESMQAGLTSDPTRTMLEHLLTAKVVVSVASVHYVQKKWPMAEMLCGLARNMAAGPHGRSPLIVDAMPGGAKLRAMDHDPSLWLEDLTVLIPTPLPSMQKYNKGSDLLQHCRVITKLAVDSRRQYIHLASVGGDLSSWHGKSREAQAWGELFLVDDLSESQVRALLQGEPPHTFSVLPATSSQDCYSYHKLQESNKHHGQERIYGAVIITCRSTCRRPQQGGKPVTVNTSEHPFHCDKQTIFYNVHRHEFFYCDSSGHRASRGDPNCTCQHQHQSFGSLHKLLAELGCHVFQPHPKHLSKWSKLVQLFREEATIAASTTTCS